MFDEFQNNWLLENFDISQSNVPGNICIIRGNEQSILDNKDVILKTYPVYRYDMLENFINTKQLTFNINICVRENTPHYIDITYNRFISWKEFSDLGNICDVIKNNLKRYIQKCIKKRGVDYYET